MTYFLISIIFSIQNNSLPLFRSENVWLYIEMSTTDTFVSLLPHIKLYDELFYTLKCPV
jgi:hypothetical protein